MTIPTSNRSYTVGTGTAASMVPFVALVAPASTNIRGPNGVFSIGQIWINSAANTVYVLTSFTASAGSVTATWTSV